jgi:beta-aspartyl-dipeptidase (metallo-type)
MLLIKNAQVYAPEKVGSRDLLIAGGTIVHMAEQIDHPGVPCRVMDARGQRLCPGFIDQHVHVTGGGGEGGYHTRTPEVQLSSLIRGGITTVVGLLGTDGATRSIEDLYAKTMALNEEGVTAYMLTGAYGFPGPTITGAPDRDMLFCEKVLGIKLALSDHRSSHVTEQELIRLGSQARVAGMLSGKGGFVTLHMGEGKAGLRPVMDALAHSDLPVGVFRPTHIGRKDSLREDAYTFLQMGGYIDFTCGAITTGGPGDGILEAIRRELPQERITVSSDEQGSWSNYDEDGRLLEIGVSSAESLSRELRSMVTEKGFALAAALPYFTSNVAAALGLTGKKGTIRESADADLVLLNEDCLPEMVIAGGTVLMEKGNLLRKGTYE